MKLHVLFELSLEASLIILLSSQMDKNAASINSLGVILFFFFFYIHHFSKFYILNLQLLGEDVHVYT